MEKVIKYKSIDGLLFNNECDCVEYESWYEKGIGIISQLRHRPSNDFDFNNGKGYVQQNIETLYKVKSEFLNLANEMGKNSGRDVLYFFNNNHSGLYGLYQRVECIDSLGREFGQMYFALNPDKAELIEL